MPRTPPVILSIAGYDPSSGAGITADVKTAAALGCFAATCITAVTIQSSRGVKKVLATPLEIVKNTIFELVGDMKFGAVRLGMLGSGKVAVVVADFLERFRPPHVVLDPIVRSSSGAELIDPSGLEIVRTRLLRLAEIVTPNIEEAAALTGLKVGNLPEMEAAAVRLHQMGAANVVITGGHLPEPTDLLSQEDGQGGHRIEHLKGKKLVSRSTHGTGCAFATAVACGLARGKSVEQAVAAAKDYVTNAIQHAYPLGRGTGPINHMWRWEKR